jgi:hypothetical protein
MTDEPRSGVEEQLTFIALFTWGLLSRRLPLEEMPVPETIGTLEPSLPGTLYLRLRLRKGS